MTCCLHEGGIGVIGHLKAVHGKGSKKHGPLRLLVWKSAAVGGKTHPEFARGNPNHAVAIEGTGGPEGRRKGQSAAEEETDRQAGHGQRFLIPQARATPSR